MKKITSILSIAVIATFVFLSTKNVDQSTNIDLRSLISLNTANAECSGDPYLGNNGQCSFDGICFWAGQYPPERNNCYAW